MLQLYSCIDIDAASFSPKSSLDFGLRSPAPNQAPKPEQRVWKGNGGSSYCPKRGPKAFSGVGPGLEMNRIRGPCPLTDAQTETGPYSCTIGQAGHGCGTHLQRQITEQIEQIERDALHRDILLLPRTDTRRIAWLAVDRLSSQWVPAWPTRTVELSRAEMPEVMTTYLGRESPALRHLAGRFIPCTHTSRGGRGGRGRQGVRRIRLSARFGHPPRHQRHRMPR